MTYVQFNAILVASLICFLCIQFCLGLLNSILDTSKIEVGKMLLNEEEFDLSHLLEEVVDIYHLVSMEKGVDLILDPCNGSIIKYSQVKGDKQRLKQVLCNLLSNAVKFTKEGHITVRVWAQKPTLSNSIIKTNQHSITKHLSCLFSKKNEPEEDLEKTMNSVKQELHSMDFVFEVDDTGKGIPKENYKSVFENYVQVKETDPVQEGTGLGLGIVQSLVGITYWLLLNKFEGLNMYLFLHIYPFLLLVLVKTRCCFSSMQINNILFLVLIVLFYSFQNLFILEFVPVTCRIFYFGPHNRSYKSIKLNTIICIIWTNSNINQFCRD